jgi:glycosyltransferase involved in cell wall biosynthesis
VDTTIVETAHIPKVSIGMPVYNGEPFIREALDSLLAQTFTDFELIISDNASTDKTEQICREYAAKDKRIRYIRQEINRGAMPNFQYVLDEAVGEYFMWAAADDWWNHDYIRITKSILDSNPSAGLAFSFMEVKNLISGDSIKSITGFVTTKNKLIKFIFRMCELCPSLIYGLYRTNIVKKLKLSSFDYFDIYLSLWFELNSSIVVIPSYLYIAGTNGVRIPYSIEGNKYISYDKFIIETYKLLRNHFGIIKSMIAVSIAWYLIAKNTNSVNRKIKKANQLHMNL